MAQKTLYHALNTYFHNTEPIIAASNEYNTSLNLHGRALICEEIASLMVVLVHFKRDALEFALGSGCLLSDEDVNCKPVILSVRKIIRQRRRDRARIVPILPVMLMKMVIFQGSHLRKMGQRTETNLNVEIDGTG